MRSDETKRGVIWQGMCRRRRRRRVPFYPCRLACRARSNKKGLILAGCHEAAASKHLPIVNVNVTCGVYYQHTNITPTGKY